MLDEAEDLAYAPSGGRAKQWLAGVLLASLPVLFGAYCIQRGYTPWFGRVSSGLKLTGSAGTSVACAYIATGAFIHFHYFWGLSDRLWKFSQALKVVSLLVFLSALCCALYLAFA